MLKAGDWIFTDKFKVSPEPGIPVGRVTKGNIICLVVGFVKEGCSGPTRKEMTGLLSGKIGLVSLDTVKKVLGQEAIDKLGDALRGEIDEKAGSIQE
jgi:hypothetical protein